MKNRYFQRIGRKILNIIIGIILILSSVISFTDEKVYATNYVANPSFTGGSSSWSLSTTTYDATYYQDSAGSAKTATASGKNKDATGTATQTLATNIGVGDVVLLSAQWSKQCLVNCDLNTISIEIAKPSTPSTWVAIWTDTSIPSPGSATSWTGPSATNVSSYITESGQYGFRIYANLSTGNSNGAQSLAWFDALNLDVTNVITIGTTGTQTSTLQVGQSNAYIGGAFSAIRSSSSTSVTSITISETGTISDANISGLILYYKQEATCSTSIPSGTTTFNSTPGTFSSGSSTVTGSMTVGTSQICIYVEIDVGSGASVDNTIEIQITNPSTQVTASAGNVTPATAVAISGTTTIVAAGSLTLDIVDASDQIVGSPSVNFTSTPFDWVVQQSTGTLGVTAQKIKVTNTTATPTWTLSIAATDGDSDLWDSGIYTYDYNGTQAAGRLQVNPSVETITPGGSCSNTGLSAQSAQYFASGSVTSINLVVAGASAETGCSWYITGVALTQDIPAEQNIASYSIGMTITVI